jgi:hypothetical protein
VKTGEGRDDSVLGTPPLIGVEEGCDRGIVPHGHGPAIAHRGVDVRVAFGRLANERREDDPTAHPTEVQEDSAALSE